MAKREPGQSRPAGHPDLAARAVTAEAAARAARVDTALRARAVPERAAGEKAYLKSSLEHYGVSMPGIAMPPAE